MKWETAEWEKWWEVGENAAILQLSTVWSQVWENTVPSMDLESQLKTGSLQKLCSLGGHCWQYCYPPPEALTGPYSVKLKHTQPQRQQQQAGGAGRRRFRPLWVTSLPTSTSSRWTSFCTSPLLSSTSGHTPTLSERADNCLLSLHVPPPPSVTTVSVTLPHSFSASSVPS